ncbi:PAS domain S-box protein [Nitrospira lenta]|uniref:histidine kinase n=1 Tax=Nitrospira lenta TaxID=1436998 RepID=A0A330L0I3_9BACT|nr:PAS domain S-box protein [Nitrospira lenta]SPP63164.1 putative Histidine kinase [Nitrospira lenta]
MSPPLDTSTRLKAGAILLLTLSIFGLDLLTPLGWADWLLYFIPLVMTLQSLRDRDAYNFVAAVTLLTALGGYFSPRDIHPAVALMNRAFGLMIMWGVTWIIVRQRQVQSQLVGARAAQAQAEAGRKAAVAARELAEASATGAIHRESQAARELLLSSLRLDGIVQSAMDAIITSDERMQVLLFNEAAERMFQCPAREAIGQSVDKFLPARFRDAHRHHVEEFGRSRVTSRKMGQLGKVMGLRANGEEFPVEAAISHIVVEGKTLYTVILRDIAERLRAEEQLRGIEERSRLALEAGQLGAWEHDVATGLVQLDARAQAIYRCGTGVSLGTMIACVHPDDAHALQELMTSTHRPDAPDARFTSEYRMQYPDGEVRWMVVRAQAFFDGAGQGFRVTRVVGTTQDVTARKRVEHLIRQSEERYRRLVAVSPYGILVVRADRIIFANDQALKLFGAVKAEEIVGRSPFELFHPECHDAMRERAHALLGGSQVTPMVEERIVKQDGTPMDVEVSSAGFSDEEGPAILAMLRDISERKRLQERLRKTERIAELGTVASGMAHEIGTPMNVILGRAEYLMDRVTDETVKRGLQTIVAQVERITRVMNQLLAFARRKPSERGPLFLRDVIENSVEMFQERLVKSRVQVEMQLDEACPRVQADADQMNQVLINLIMNAIHAMPDGGQLRIGMVPADDMVKLTVADTGHGIPQAVIAKVFTPFFTTKEFGKGTGLGLTVVKGIIEEHHGSIVAESQEGQGTTFTILLPKSG